MTTRYLTTDQNGNGDQTYWDINGYFLHGPSGEKLNLGGGNTTVTASNEIVQIGTSYLRIPQGISNERPDISNSYIGMMRYLTTENLLEYFNGQTNTWLPISLPNPTLTSITPNYINFDTSGGETNTNTYTLTGSNFNNEVGGISVEVIGNNGTGTILNPDFNNVSSETSATFTFDPSGTEQLIGISNELNFAVKLTNTNSGFSSTLNNAIIATNAGPEFTQPTVFTPSSFQTFAVQDPCANFIVGGIDLSSPPHYPLDFSFVSGTAGGFNVGGGDISSISDFSSIVQVPSGNRLRAIAGSYNFTMRVTDASLATSDANYTLSLANPTITSIDPSYIYDTSVVDINITGTYFIRDSDISFNKGSNTLFQSEVSYNNITSLTVKDVSAGSGGQYDISLANGSVIVNVPSVVLNILSINQIQFSTTNLSSTTYLEAGGINDSLSPTGSGSAVIGGWTVLRFNGPTGSITFTNLLTSNQIRYLVIGGGGGGGGTDGGADATGGAGGGGAGGYKDETTTSFTNNTSYTITVGNGGAGGTSVGNGSTGSFGQPGDDSSISTIVSVDGGGSGGSSYANGNNTNGGNGGSGGGAGGSDTAGKTGGTATSGNIGGNTDNGGGGAGGGGAGAVGIGNSGQSAGNGGSGSSSNITGSAVTRAGGGGGGTGASANAGTGGTGGGGQGASRGNNNSTAGTVNTGSGGGGGCDYDATQSEGAGSAGGSGIIILRIPSYIYTLPP
jgi:hypothetical protein